MTSSAAIEALYVVDTNALIWYLTTHPKLSLLATQVFSAAEHGETRLYISAITVAELYYANKKWNLFDDFNQTYHDLKSRAYFRFVPFLPDDVMAFDKTLAVPEMHDRIIAGLAKRLDAPLLTSYPLIIAANIVPTVW